MNIKKIFIIFCLTSFFHNYADSSSYVISNPIHLYEGKIGADVIQVLRYGTNKLIFEVEEYTASNTYTTEHVVTYQFDMNGLTCSFPSFPFHSQELRKMAMNISWVCPSNFPEGLVAAVDKKRLLDIGIDPSERTIFGGVSSGGQLDTNIFVVLCKTNIIDICCLTTAYIVNRTLLKE